MRPFDTVIVVDWSGGKDRGATPKKDAIWIGVTRDGKANEPVYCRTRKVAEDTLRQMIGEETRLGRRVLAAFDFPFGYPAGFVRTVTGSDDPFAFWQWLEERVTEDDAGQSNRFDIAAELNRRFEQPGPFWGKPWQWTEIYHDIPFGKVKDAVVFAPFDEYREAERHVRATSGKVTSSCFQLSGNPTVGSQMLTGLPVLQRLRQLDGVRVWPFEETADAGVVLAEIWPSLVDRAVAASGDAIRDRAQVRLLSLALSRLPAERLAVLMEVPEIAREEAWILGAGAHEELEALAAPRLTPPRLKNDCFALPPGVDWTPVDAALARLRERLRPVVAVDEVSLGAAGGRVLADEAAALRANPPAANSAVDGFGFAHASASGEGDLTLSLVQGRAAAGVPFGGVVPPGCAVRILTGAMLPEGVDTVVLEEDCASDGGHVAFRGPVKKGANTRKAGEDVAAGAVALTAGTRLDAAEVALLSAVGVTRVPVFAPLRVGVLSTGDEIVPAGTTEAASRTYDANRPMLLELVRDWRMTPVDLGHVADDRNALRATLDGAAGTCDAILTSGGASAGDEDHVSALLGDTGSRADWRIALKPGRPLALGMWRGVPVFGLPGNPVAALVCSLMFARPAFAMLGGEGWREPVGFTVPAAFSKNKKAGRREYLRARMRGDGSVEVFPSEGSGRISGLAWADGLVELEDGAREIRPGDQVRYIPYASFR